MIGQLVFCAREECKKEFKKSTHNQKYCTNECCRIETNRKIMEKYHERAAIKKGKKRECKSCGTSLSRYNETKFCNSCQYHKKTQNLGEASRIMASVAWF